MMRENEELVRRYERSVRLILLVALRDVCPGAVLRVDHSVKKGVYMNVQGVSLTASLVHKIEQRMREIVKQNLPLVRTRWTREQAIAYFTEQGQADTVRLLQYRPYDFFDVYTCDGLSEYFYGDMVETTGEVDRFALKFYYPGLVLLLPEDIQSGEPAPFTEMPKLMHAYAEANVYDENLKCKSVADLNEWIASGEVRTLVRANESLQVRAMGKIADAIVARGARVVFVAGPSSSGKTTFANRLSVELRVLGKRPVAVSLDDYYLNRDQVPLDAEGKPDLECLEALDVNLFNEQLIELLAGREVEVPRFSFKNSCREPHGEKLTLHENDVLVVEGIHGLNEKLSSEVPAEMKFRVYVCAMSPLNMDGHNRIHAADVRLMRRLVRDARTRGTDVEKTLEMWDSVREGERKYIFPYQEQADVLFNTSLLYEIAVLKKYAYPLLHAVSYESPYGVRAHRLCKFLHYFKDMTEEDEIPPTSILREFIGGCTFYDEKS